MRPDFAFGVLTGLALSACLLGVWQMALRAGYNAALELLTLESTTPKHLRQARGAALVLPWLGREKKEMAQ